MAEACLRETHEAVAPIASKFSLRYDSLGEILGFGRVQGCNRRYTHIENEPAKSGEGTVKKRTHRRCIYIRVRRREDPHCTFISLNSRVATLLHEMAHLRISRHNLSFAKLLRDLYAYASEIGVMDHRQPPELALPCPWEREIYNRGGGIGDAELEKRVQDARGQWLCGGHGDSAASTPEDVCEAHLAASVE